MVLQGVVTLVAELNLLQVELDAHVRHIHVPESYIPAEVVGGAVSYVSEGVEEFLAPILEERIVTEEGLA